MHKKQVRSSIDDALTPSIAVLLVRPLAEPFSCTGTLILSDVLDDKVECDWICLN
jgi:hypothetical protein